MKQNFEKPITLESALAKREHNRINARRKGFEKDPLSEQEKKLISQSRSKTRERIGTKTRLKDKIFEVEEYHGENKSTVFRGKPNFPIETETDSVNLDNMTLEHIIGKQELLSTPEDREEESLLNRFGSLDPEVIQEKIHERIANGEYEESPLEDTRFSEQLPPIDRRYGHYVNIKNMPLEKIMDELAKSKITDEPGHVEPYSEFQEKSIQKTRNEVFSSKEQRERKHEQRRESGSWYTRVKKWFKDINKINEYKATQNEDHEKQAPSAELLTEQGERAAREHNAALQRDQEVYDKNLRGWAKHLRSNGKFYESQNSFTAKEAEKLAQEIKIEDTARYEDSARARDVNSGTMPNDWTNHPGPEDEWVDPDLPEEHELDSMAQYDLALKIETDFHDETKKKGRPSRKKIKGGFNAAGMN